MENKDLVPKQDDYATDLQTFEKGFLENVSRKGLPVEGIFINVDERVIVFNNINKPLQYLDGAKKEKAIYLTKFLAAVAAGLFDAALNYLWDQTIIEIRNRVIQYDIDYFYDNVSINEERRKNLHGQDDIIKLNDSELILGARNIGLISEIGYKLLDHILYIRNWASAAHPNQNQLTGLQLASWLETCIKEVIALPLSTNIIVIKKLLSNIKINSISENDAKQIASVFRDLSSQQVRNLSLGLAGIYTDASTSQETRQNIHYLLPYLWIHVDEETKQGFGIKYGKFVANNEKAKADFARQFLEIVSGVSYIPDNLKAAEIEIAIQNLLEAHKNSSNFYIEPIFAKQLIGLVGQTGNIPNEVKKLYIAGLIEVFLTNGNGVAWNAESYYIELINKFSQEEAIYAMLSFTNEYIASKLQFDLCQQKYKELLELIKGKLTSPSALEVYEAIKKFTGPLDNIRNDSSIKQKINTMEKIMS